MKLSDITLYYPHDVRAAFQMYQFLSRSVSNVPSVKVSNEKEIVSMARANKLDAGFISLIGFRDFPEEYVVLETGTVFSPLEQTVHVEGSSSEAVLEAASTILAQLNASTQSSVASSNGMSTAQRWLEHFKSPLPEAVFCIHKRFGPQVKLELEQALKTSRSAALTFKQRALHYAVNFSEIFELPEAEKFCTANFSDLTESLGPDGHAALKLFLSEI